MKLHELLKRKKIQHLRRKSWPKKMMVIFPDNKKPSAYWDGKYECFLFLTKNDILAHDWELITKKEKM